MRNVLKDYDKDKLQKRVDQKIGEGWKQLSEIKLQEQTHFNQLDTYFCVMELPDKPHNRKKRFNFTM